MMKKTSKGKSIGMMILGLSLLAAPAFGQQDYGSMTNEELAAKRGTMQEAGQEDRDTFQQEWQSRGNNMSQEERQQAVGRPENAPRDGSGNKYGQGQGNGKGGNGGGRGGRR